MLEPLPGPQWNTATAAHLMNRAGFGASPQDIENVRQLGLDKAVSWFLDYEKIPDPTPAPDWAQPDPAIIARREAIRNAADPETRKMLQQQQSQEQNSQMADLRYWWVRRMALGSRPFQEKMTLFWHGHFATSAEKVQMPYFLWLQNETLRQKRHGQFQPVAHRRLPGPRRCCSTSTARAVTRARRTRTLPAKSWSSSPSAKAITPSRTSRRRREPTPAGAFRRTAFTTSTTPTINDEEPKTVFGQTGNYSGEDVLNLIGAKPECAQFIAKKLWRFFAQDQPPQPVIDALAEQFHKSGMDIKHLMRLIFRSREFYAPDVIRSQIKSPVQWLLASAHQLQAPLPTEPMSLVMLRQLGEELFNPPNVKGWDGGIAWITTNNLLDRYNFAAALVEGDRVPLPGLMGQMRGLMNNMAEDGLMVIPPADVSPLFTTVDLSNPYSFLAALQSRFLNAELAPQRLASLTDFLKSRSPLEETDIRKAIRLVMSTPEYQLT